MFIVNCSNNTTVRLTFFYLKLVFKLYKYIDWCYDVQKEIATDPTLNLKKIELGLL